MFWQKFIELCRKVDKSPNAVAAEIGIKSSGTVTGWKNGSKPRPSIIAAICEYFGLPLEYFDDDEWDSYPDGVINLREELRESPGFTILFDTFDGATEADLLEAAAMIQRRKEERSK